MSIEELQRGAVTVVDLAGHFHGLKLRASEFIDAFEASERGYFTPDEDEQTRHLLVSYGQARNALFELVTSFHSTERFAEEWRPLALLTAYSGALVLVDAARFLREMFHDRPVVRSKLNEPDRVFGIPAGTYDLVQKSLTSPVHAWHLYHAFMYVSENRDMLAEMAETNAQRHLLEIVNQLESRLDVTVDRFVLVRARVRSTSLNQRFGTGLLARALYGLQKCVSRLIADCYLKVGHQPGLPSTIEAEIEQQMRPGDVVIVRKEHAFTNYFLPGYWPHAALYLGSLSELQDLKLNETSLQPHWTQLESLDSSRQTRVLESMKDGVRFRSLSNPFRSDAIAVIRPRLDREQVSTAIARGCQHANKPYDFDFDFTTADKLVCTEVVYRAFDQIGDINFALTKRAGRLTLSAEDLLQMAVDGNGFDPLAVYCPALSSELQSAEAGTEFLRRTIGRKSVS